MISRKTSLRLPPCGKVGRRLVLPPDADARFRKPFSLPLDVEPPQNPR